MKGLLYFIFLSYFQQVIQSQTVFPITSDIKSQGRVGCYDTSDCGNTLCRTGCVDCSSATVCTTCEYGYFLLNTPENTVECVKCPGRDASGTPTVNDLNTCGNCLEMPNEWQYIRKCTFKYEFPSNDINNTPRNVTINQPVIYTMGKDFQGSGEQNYFTEILINFCSNYEWQNFVYNDIVTAEEIQEYVDEYNDPECTECLTGFILNNGACEQCKDSVAKCSSCYNDKDGVLTCSICSSGYLPDSEGQNCITCQSQIENCKECYYNSQRKRNQCSTCSSGFALNEENTECITRVCSDENCQSCSDDVDVCQKCIDRYTVDNDACVVAEECDEWTIEDSTACSACYTAVGSDPQCLFCGDTNVGDTNYFCIEYCKQNYGRNPFNGECFECSDTSVHADAIQNCRVCKIVDNGGTAEYDCFRCAVGYGFDTNDQCVQCTEEGCTECSIDGSNNQTCQRCETTGYVFNGTGCSKCTDVITDCTECSYELNDNGDGLVYECTKCNTPKLPDALFDPAGAAGAGVNSSCVLECDSYFDELCTADCQANDKYLNTSAVETYYPSFKLLCNKCEPINNAVSSLSSDGKSCYQNPINCFNSLRLTETQSKGINWLFYQESGDSHETSICFNKCELQTGESALAGDQAFFLDPLTQKCTICGNDHDFCRKTITIKKYFFCSSKISTAGFHADLPTGGDAPSIVTDPFNWQSGLDLQFNFAGDASTLNDEAFSQFVLEMIFVGSASKPDQNQCQLNQFTGFAGSFDINSNISSNIFRINQLDVVFQTFDNDSGTLNGVVMEFYTTELTFSITNILGFTIKNIHFIASETILTNEALYELFEDDESVIETAPILFEMQDNLLNNRFTMENVKFFNTPTYHIVPKFQFEDLGYLSIKDFSYESLNTDSNQVTGFQLFDFKIYRGVTQFELEINNFFLYNMLLNKQALFKLPVKNAKVSITNITLDTIIMRQSYIIQDISTGFGKGEQWITVNGLNMYDAQLFDSSLMDVKNAKFCYNSNWNLENINVILVDNLETQLLNLNTFIMSTVTIKSIFLYNAVILRNQASPSVVVNYRPANVLKTFELQDVTVYGKSTDPLLSIYVQDLNLILSDVIIKNIEIASSTQFNSDVKVYLSEEWSNVFAIQNYDVIVLTLQSYPDYILQAQSVSANKKVSMNNVSFDRIDKKINAMSLLNAKILQIEDLSCVYTNIEGQQQGNMEGYCLNAYSTVENLEEVKIKKMLLQNIEHKSSHPLHLQGFKNYQIEGLACLDLTVQQGVVIQPSKDAVIVFKNSLFQNIQTSYEIASAVYSAGIDFDFSGATQVSCTLQNSIFNYLFSRIQAAGVRFVDPSITIEVTIDKCLFNDVHSFQGGAILGQFQSKLTATVIISNTQVIGAADSENIYIDNGDTIFIEQEIVGYDGDNKVDGVTFKTEATAQVTQTDTSSSSTSLSEFLNNIVTLYNNQDENDFETDTALITVSLQPSSVQIERAVITMTNVIIKDIHYQQALVLLNTQLTATGLQLINNNCDDCSENFNGSSYFQQTQFNIETSVFQKNYALKGGALYIADGTNTANKEFNYIKTSKFEENTCYSQGGALYIKDTFYYIEECEFNKNQAFGKAHDTDSTLSIRGEGGGVYASVSNSADSNLASATRLLADSTSTMYIKNTKFVSNTAQYGASGKFQGKTITNSGNTFSGNVAHIYGDNELINECVFGEGTLSDGTCESCPENKYTVSLGASCTECPDHSTCKLDQIYVDPGYWRPHNYSDSVNECYNNDAVCLGGNTNNTCSEGHLGALCEACDLRGIIWGQTYSVSSSYNCGTCDDETTNALKVLGGNVVVFISMILAVKGTIKIVQDKIQLKAIKHLFKGFTPDEDESGILIKMFTNYFQIISIIATFRIDLPSALLDGQDAVGNPVKSLGNALDCYLVKLQDEIPNIYFRLIWQLVMNTIQFTLFVLVFALLKILKKTQIKFSSLMWTTFIYLLIYLQPSYVNSILELVSCRSIGGYSYIVADVQYQCYTDEYNLWSYAFLVPFLIFWVVLLPLWMFIMLYANVRLGQLQKSHVLYKFGFIYQEYEERSYYWELIKVFQKMLIVAVIQLYSQEIKVKAILVFMIVFVYGIISYFKRPYKNERLNNIDIYSSGVCSLSLIIGIFLYNNDFDYWVVIGFVVIIGLNLFFIIFMIKQILRKVINKQLKKNADKIDKMKNKIPALKKYVAVTPESIMRGKNNWKKIRNRVMLLKDGVTIGLCELMMPDEHHQKQQKDNLYYMNEEQLQKSGVKDKSKLTMFATLAAEKQEYTEQDKQNKEIAEKMEKLNKMLEEDRKKHKDDKHDEIDLKEFQDDPNNVWDGKKIGALDLLTGQIDPKLLEFLEEKVNKFRVRQQEQFARDKAIFRDYFAKELHWDEIQAKRAEERQAKIDKRQNKKAQKMHKKTGKDLEECLQIVKEEEAEEERKKKEKEQEKENKDKDKNQNLNKVVPETNQALDSENPNVEKIKNNNQFYEDSQQLVQDQKEDDISPQNK